MTRAFAAAATCLPLALLASPAQARDPQAWSTVSAVADLGDDWRLNVEASGRTEANEREPQLLFRAQAGRKLGRDVTFWLGYVRTETLNEGRRNGAEERATGQLDWTIARSGPYRVTSRTRTEARFIRGSDETAWRLREQLRLNRSVGKVELSAGVEPFVALNRTGGTPRRLEQLRFTGNVIVPLTGWAALDVGYLHQRLHRASGLVVNHVVPVTLRLSF